MVHRGPGFGVRGIAWRYRRKFLSFPCWRPRCRGRPWGSNLSIIDGLGSSSGLVGIRLRGPTVALGSVEDVAGGPSSVLGSAPKAVGELGVPQDGHREHKQTPWLPYA